MSESGLTEAFEAIPEPLLPCPLCGSTDLRKVELWIGAKLSDGVECDACDMQARLSFWNGSRIYARKQEQQK
jgi:hypothetical protein